MPFGGAGSFVAVVPWQAVQVSAGASMMPSTCRVKSFHTTVGGALPTPGVNELMTAPWQSWQFVFCGCWSPGGVVWQLWPHES